MAKKKAKTKKKTKKRVKRKTQDSAAVRNTSYDVENAADTLMRANEINSNPTLKRKAKALLKRRQALIGKTINEK